VAGRPPRRRPACCQPRLTVTKRSRRPTSSRRPKPPNPKVAARGRLESATAVSVSTFYAREKTSADADAHRPPSRARRPDSVLGLLGCSSPPPAPATGCAARRPCRYRHVFFVSKLAGVGIQQFRNSPRLSLASGRFAPRRRNSPSTRNLRGSRRLFPSQNIMCVDVLLVHTHDAWLHGQVPRTGRMRDELS
jgi:hypothetical protein